ncbi:MAG TPA: EamA family transporter [Dissulfurispiraceae bacterium]
MKQQHTVRLGLTLAIALDTGIQLFWKSAVSHIPPSAGAWETISLTLRQPLFHVVLVMVVLQFANWMTVLGRADLSYSQPITALSLVTVTVLSFLLLDEKVSPLRIAGMVLILAGVWSISATGHRTTKNSPSVRG